MESYSKAATERAMKVQEVILRAVAKKITWWQAAEIIGISDRSMRVGQKPEHSGLLNFQGWGNFWRAVSGNFIDICVLEWCKLFADPNGKHHWSKIVSDPTSFKTQLLDHLGIDETDSRKSKSCDAIETSFWLTWIPRKS
jgi:hypothetical protein